MDKQGALRETLIPPMFHQKLFGHSGSVGTSRLGAIKLWEASTLMHEHAAREREVSLNESVEIWDLVLSEVSRQVWVHCAERGLLVEHIRLTWRGLFDDAINLLREEQSQVAMLQAEMEEVEAKLAAFTQKGDGREQSLAMKKKLKAGMRTAMANRYMQPAVRSRPLGNPQWLLDRKKDEQIDTLATANTNLTKQLSDSEEGNTIATQRIAELEALVTSLSEKLEVATAPRKPRRRRQNATLVRQKSSTAGPDKSSDTGGGVDPTYVREMQAEMDEVYLDLDHKTFEAESRTRDVARLNTENKMLKEQIEGITAMLSAAEGCPQCGMLQVQLDSVNKAMLDLNDQAAATSEQLSSSRTNTANSRNQGVGPTITEIEALKRNCSKLKAEAHQKSQEMERIQGLLDIAKNESAILAELDKLQKGKAVMEQELLEAAKRVASLSEDLDKVLSDQAAGLIPTAVQSLADQQKAATFQALSADQQTEALKTMAPDEMATVITAMSATERGKLTPAQLANFEQAAIDSMNPVALAAAMASMTSDEKLEFISKQSLTDQKKAKMCLSSADRLVVKKAARMADGEGEVIAEMGRSQMVARIQELQKMLQAAVFVYCRHCGKDMADATEQELAASLIQKNFRIKNEKKSPAVASRIDCQQRPKFVGKTITWIHQKAAKLFADKIIADEVDDKKGHLRQTMIEFLIEWSRMNFGPNHAKELETFLSTLFRYKEDSIDVKMLLNFVELPEYNMLHIQNVFLHTLLIQGDHKKKRGPQFVVETSWGVIAQAALGELDATLQQQLYQILEELWNTTGSLMCQHEQNSRKIPSPEFRTAITEFHMQLEGKFANLVQAVFKSIDPTASKCFSSHVTQEQFEGFVAFFDPAGSLDILELWQTAAAHTHRMLPAEDELDEGCVVNYTGIVALCESRDHLMKGSPFKQLFRLHFTTLTEDEIVKPLLGDGEATEYRQAAVDCQRSTLQPQEAILCKGMTQKVEQARHKQSEFVRTPTQ